MVRSKVHASLLTSHSIWKRIMSLQCNVHLKKKKKKNDVDRDPCITHGCHNERQIVIMIIIRRLSNVFGVFNSPFEYLVRYGFVE